MINIKCFSGTELVEFSKLRGDMKLSYVQLEPGEFRGEASIIDLKDVLIVNRKTNLSYFITGGVPGYVGFSFPLNMDLAHFFNKSPCTAHRQSLIANNTTQCAVFPKNFHHINVLIKVDSLRSYLDENQCNTLLNTMGHANYLSVDPQCRQKMSDFVLKCHDEILSASEAGIDNEVIAEKFSKLIIEQLYDYLASYAVSKKPADNPGNRARVLYRCLRFIIQQQGLPVSLDQLCSNTFASKRSVQYAFSEYLDFTRARFSNVVRLNAVKADLLGTREGKGLITKVFRKFRVSNTARFRQEYFNFFKEYPKDTVSKQSRLRDIPLSSAA